MVWYELFHHYVHDMFFVQRGNSALHHAAMKGEAEIMKTLIKAGSEINAQDKVPVHVVPVKFLHVL